MQLGPPNLTQKFLTMSHENPFILGSKGQGHEAWVFTLLWVPTSSSSHCSHSIHGQTYLG